MLDQSDVGHRVVVRRLVGLAQNGRPLFGDLIGDLLEIGEHAVLRTTDGAVHRIPLDQVAAAKRVPPWRPSNRAIRELELAAAAGWPAPDVERLGDWLLRAADGFTGRANSTLAMGDPGMPRTAALAAVRSWYASRGLPARIATPLPLAADLADWLAAAGWVKAPPVLVQTAPLTAIPTGPAARSDTSPTLRTSSTPRDRTIRLTGEPSAQWLALAGVTRRIRPQGDAGAAGVTGAAGEASGAAGAADDTSAAADAGAAGVAGAGELSAAVRHVLCGPEEVCFAEAYHGHDLVGVARGVRIGRWLGIAMVEVVASARRQGYARALIGELAAWAGQAGATRAYLQVLESNQPALACYATLGFRTHHTYLTWQEA